MSKQGAINDNKPHHTEVRMDRRNFVIGAGVLASAAATGTAFAAEHKSRSHRGHGRKNQALVDAAMGCISAGQACIDHCLELFKAGDTSVAECAASVQEMLAFCTAFSQFASYDSRHLKNMARICVDVCKDCEKECRKHEKKHAECKDCADACAESVRQCKKFLS